MWAERRILERLTEVFLTLTEVFLCFFLSCKENARVKLAKTGHGPHSSKLVIVCVVLLLFALFCVLFVCKCVPYYCHRLTTQLQLTNRYHIKPGGTESNATSGLWRVNLKHAYRIPGTQMRSLVITVNHIGCRPSYIRHGNNDLTEHTFPKL
jgi:hypothetical protein